MGKFSPWNIVRPLNEDGEAHTFIVFRDDDERKSHYVLKSIKNDKQTKKFKSEIRAGLQLKSPFLAETIDYNLNDEPYYMVFPYYRGGTLRNLDTEHTALVQRLQLFRKICVGLSYGHKRGIIHKNLSPDNIFINESQQIPYIAGFGLAFVTNDGSWWTASEETIHSSIHYEAPEVRNGNMDDVTEATDIYSLGKILYFMVSGRELESDNHREPNFDIIQLSPATENYFINDLLDKMITANPQKRYREVQDVTGQIDTIIKRINIKAHHISLKAKQHCNYCGVGEYIINFDDRVENQKRLSSFGLLPSTGNKWLVLSCNFCGNMQIFRPDTTDNPDRWYR